LLIIGAFFVDAQKKFDIRKEEYNGFRPHSLFGGHVSPRIHQNEGKYPRLSSHDRSRNMGGVQQFAETNFTSALKKAISFWK
jgi:hypothetical protein